MGTTRITAEPGTPFIDMSREFDAPRGPRPADDDGRALRRPRRRHVAIYPSRCRRKRVRLPRGLSRQPVTGRHGPDVRVRGAPGHVSLDSIRLEERDGRTLLQGRSVFQSVEARDAMVQSGMETGLTEGYERLDQLLAALVPVR